MRFAVIAGGALVPLCADSMDQWSGSARATTSAAMWATWAVSLLCVLVPSSVSLTVIRLVWPSSVVITGVTVVDGANVGSVVALSLAVVASLLVFSADVGDTFVQVSAYGDERRHLLRCPPMMIFVQVTAWLVWVSSIAMGATFAIDSNTVPLTLATIVALVSSTILPRRFHRFSRRWLVQVPAGLVVHDHVVLAETAMFMATNVESVDAVESGSTDAADLGGGSRGTAIRIVLKDLETIVLAPTRHNPGGTAIHARSVTVFPSRPGRTLAELTTPPPSTTSPRSS